MKLQILLQFGHYVLVLKHLVGKLAYDLIVLLGAMLHLVVLALHVVSLVDEILHLKLKLLFVLLTKLDLHLLSQLVKLRLLLVEHGFHLGGK